MVCTILAAGVGSLLFSPAVQATAAPSDYQGSEIERQLNAFAGKDGANLGKSQDPRVVAARLIKVSLGVVGIIVFALGVYAGFLILMSQGNEEKIAQGKKIVLYSAMGVAIILGSYSIVTMVYIGIYQSWVNPMTTGTDAYFYQNSNSPELYNPDPLEEDTTIR